MRDVDNSVQTELVAMEEKIKVIEEETEAEISQGALKDLSQKELEDKMAGTRDELEEAKSNKEFAKCSDLQVQQYNKISMYIYDTSIYTNKSTKNYKFC